MAVRARGVYSCATVFRVLVESSLNIVGNTDSEGEQLSAHIAPMANRFSCD